MGKLAFAMKADELRVPCVVKQSAIPALLGWLLFVHTFMSEGPLKLGAGFLGFACLATAIATASIELDYAADQHIPALEAMERRDLLSAVRLEAMANARLREPESVHVCGIALQALHARRVGGCPGMDSLARCCVSQTPTEAARERLYLKTRRTLLAL